MKPLVVASNLFNEIAQCEKWLDNMLNIADAGIVIVDTGSTDGTREFFMMKIEEGFPIIFITDDIILREGYGHARNHLRQMARLHFPNAHWMAYFDADERILPEDYHKLRFMKDNLTENYDVIAFPRIDWKDDNMSTMAKDWRVYPDYQARMTRLSSPVTYVRKLHEQITGHNEIYATLNNPKIHHFHRTAGQKKRDFIGLVCAKLHMEDKEYGSSYPEHHKEAMYRERFLKEGLGMKNE